MIWRKDKMLIQIMITGQTIAKDRISTSGKFKTLSVMPDQKRYTRLMENTLFELLVGVGIPFTGIMVFLIP